MPPIAAAGPQGFGLAAAITVYPLKVIAVIVGRVLFAQFAWAMYSLVASMWLSGVYVTGPISGVVTFDMCCRLARSLDGVRLFGPAFVSSVPIICMMPQNWASMSVGGLPEYCATALAKFG